MKGLVPVMRKRVGEKSLSSCDLKLIYISGGGDGGNL